MSVDHSPRRRRFVRLLLKTRRWPPCVRGRRRARYILLLYDFLSNLSTTLLVDDRSCDTCPVRSDYLPPMIYYQLQGGQEVDVVLPEPGSCVAFKGCSLGANRDIVISTEVPSVVNISTTKPHDRGPYGVGDEIDVTVWFTKPVETLATVAKVPRLRYGTMVAFYPHIEGWKIDCSGVTRKYREVISS